MYFPIKAGHKMGAQTKSLWVGSTSFPGLLHDYTGLPTSSSASQPSHPNWIDVHKDRFRLWTKASIWSMIRHQIQTSLCSQRVHIWLEYYIVLLMTLSNMNPARSHLIYGTSGFMPPVPFSHF